MAVNEIPQRDNISSKEMYAPETYMPSPDADKVPDGFRGWRGSENGGEGGLKRLVGVGEERMLCWMSGEKAKGRLQISVESVLFSYRLICVF